MRVRLFGADEEDEEQEELESGESEIGTWLFPVTRARLKGPGLRCIASTTLYPIREQTDDGLDAIDVFISALDQASEM